MPIKSYLAHPVAGKTAEMEQALTAIPECELIPATNRDVFVLITDTGSPAAEKLLDQQLQAIESLQCLALVSGFDDPAPESGA